MCLVLIKKAPDEGFDYQSEKKKIKKREDKAF